MPTEPVGSAGAASTDLEFAKGCECDGCCRLYELQVKFGLDVGNAYETADEIAGGIGTIFELMGERIDGFQAELRERERAALERAAKRIEERADGLREWMLRLDLHSAERMDKSLRAGELYGAARLVRALLGGE